MLISGISALVAVRRKTVIDGLGAVFSAIDAYVDGLEVKIDQAVQGAGIVCEGSTKRRCPVDTGRLRSSYKYTNQGKMECTVGTNTFYAPFVEFGTSRARAQPHLFPGFQDGVKALEDDLKSL
jgi:HK97 gp10 family phage protein